MRHIGGHDGSIQQAVEAERARRHFLKVEDVAKEVERYRADVIEPHMKALVELISPNAMRREATRLFLIRTAEQLAGEGASPMLKMVALGVVLFDAESHVASARVLGSAARGVPHLSLVRWRESAELRMNAKLRTLAYVRDLETNSLRGSLARLRIAAG
jgi:hypothetical protein